ncbi:MAG TPA: type VI secretion system ImpA family N-terminal domain-containing protein [Roseiarcus sp.]|jgi:type VI secretion system protein ImpA
MDDTPDATALAPVSPDAPCGPDLDLAGDSPFLNFMAATEGLLPAAFFSFDRKTIDFAAALATANGLLARSQDLRLLVLMAKLAILNRDVEAFGRWIGITAWLLAHRWDEVHPRAEDGDYSARLAYLGTLDDVPVVVLPLQYAPLVETQRDGPFAFRARLAALGEVKPREGEGFPSTGAIERMLATVDLDRLAAAHATMQRLQTDLATIAAATTERVGYESAIRFKALGPLVERMTEFLREALAKRDPSLAPAAPAQPGQADSERAVGETAATPTEFATLADVDAALGAAVGYFAAFEPSSPALLLVGQARESLGKNLYEVMKLLAPAHAEAARVFVGPDSAFTVPVSSLANAPNADFSRADPTPASSRAEALALIDAVAAHMRRVEPSSPAPYLIDRAKTLASRDFLSLLQEVLPEDDLASMKNGR